MTVFSWFCDCMIVIVVIVCCFLRTSTIAIGLLYFVLSLSFIPFFLLLSFHY